MSKAKKLIGICGVRIYEQNVMPFVQVLKRESKKKGIHLISFCSSSDSLENTDETIGQYQLVELMRNVDMCALIILTETIKNESMLKRLVALGKEKNIPVFSLDREMKGCYNLLMDNGNCFEQIVRHVVKDHGCRHVNMIAGGKGERFSEERIAAYRKVLSENGIPVEEERIDYGNYWERPVEGVMKHIFESGLPFPEAIVCANDTMAHTAISILNENGYEVPEDVIVTGYDGTKAGRYFLPSLTTGAPDYAKSVQQVFVELSKCSEGNAPNPVDISVPVIFKRRQSCGCKSKILPKNDRRISKLLTEIGNGNWHMKSMHQMISDTFGKEKIEDVFAVIPQYMDSWFNFYRYICIKSELLCSYEVSESYDKLTSVLEGNRGEFRKTGQTLEISEFQNCLYNVLEREDVSTILVHLLISGKDVYGFSLDGFEEVEDWEIKQCDEFAIFLSQILHTVIYNFKMKALNENLHEVNVEIEKMSLCDSMTGIYNRRGFFHAMGRLIEQEENSGKYLYLFMVDMDGLKYINDNFSHAEGDFAIVTLAKVLAKMENGKAVCARVGGDEFICSYVEENDGCYTSEAFSEQMQALLREEEGVNDKAYPISASVGMISEKISAALDLDAIINQADDKMYRHKMTRSKQRKQY